MSDVNKLSSFVAWSSFFIVSFYGRKQDERFAFEIVSPVESMTGTDTLVLVTVAKVTSSNSNQALFSSAPYIVAGQHYYSSVYISLLHGLCVHKFATRPQILLSSKRGIRALGATHSLPPACLSLVVFLSAVSLI